LLIKIFNYAVILLLVLNETSTFPVQ